MDNPQKIDTWTNKVVDLWKTQDLKLGTGASLDIIEKAEQYLSIEFPESFKELYKKANALMKWAGMSTCSVFGR